MSDLTLPKIGSRVMLGHYAREVDRKKVRVVVAVCRSSTSASGFTVTVSPGTRGSFTVGVDVGHITWIMEPAR